MENGILVAVGAVLMGLGPLAFLRPKWFLWGRKAKFWISLIGEAATLRIVQFLSAPLMFVGGLVVLLKALAVL